MMTSSTVDLSTLRKIRDAIAAQETSLAKLKRDLRYILKLQFGDVPAGNYSEFESDGTLKFVGDATTWADVNTGSVSLGSGASAPDLIVLGPGGNTIQVRAFDGNATTEQLFGEMEVPHGMKVPSDITFHIHWSPTTANAGNVKWQLTYVAYGNGQDLPSETTISVVAAAGGVAWKEIRSDFPTIAISSINNQISFRFFRDPTDLQDTYPDDAAVCGTIGFHYQADTVGSRQITTK